MLRIYDSAAREKVELRPRDPGRVSMYVCGPTPYDAPHVGHGRTALVFDVIRRYLRWRGFDVSYVSNVTDIEDKIIARAADQDLSESALVDLHERDYWNQLERLGVDRPDETPHATEFISQMQQLISELMDAGRAYIIEGQGVYYSVDSFEGYGELSRRSMAELLDAAGSRVEVDERKRSPVDFALWKSAKPGEPSWESPWGAGRPGWHIECSAMSLEILGDGFDLHGGGDDLLFPHHENERAQAEGAGHAFARHWLHSGMVMAGGEKMAKSLGNFTSLSDALDRHGPRAFRLLALQTHYRRQMEITDEHLASAAGGIRRLDDFDRRVRTASLPGAKGGDLDDFRSAMDDDFDTPAALRTLYERVSAGNVAIDGGREHDGARLAAEVRELVDVLGLAFEDTASGGPDADLSDADIDGLIAARDAARREKDFATADQIRDQLAEANISLEDTARGTVWHR